jgi:precorrin-6x reductase
MKRKVWLIAGTIEGRKIADALAALQVDVYVSVATAYGASLYPENPFIHVQTKRMTFADMCGFLREVQPNLVLDSTHPYAVVVTETI